MSKTAGFKLQQVQESVRDTIEQMSIKVLALYFGQNGEEKMEDFLNSCPEDSQKEIYGSWWCYQLHLLPFPCEPGG